VVGGDRDYPPYEFLDRDGRPAGYNVDLTRAIAEVMGMRVEVRLGGWSEMRDALADGRIAALQGMSYSDARSQEVDFTPPHTIVNHAIFARKGTPGVASLEELRGKKVVVHRAGIMHDTLAAMGMGPDLVLTDTPADVLRLLASGQHDYAVVAVVPGMYILRELQLTNLQPVARGVAAHRYCYAVRKGDAELLARLTEGLAILKKTGRYDDIHQRWLGVLEPREISWGTFARYGAVVVLPLLLVLGGTVLWSRSLQREVAQRTASLAREVAERQKAVEELRLNQQQLVQADKMAALGVLVSGVAHEINNPNGFILLNMPTLREAYLDALEILDAHQRVHGDFEVGGIPYARMRAEIPRMLEEMMDGARRIKRIVEDLKDFARREDAPRLERLDWNAVVQAAVRLVDNSIRKATSRFEARYAERLPPVRGNAQRVEQVVVNLVLNACQALPDAGRGVTLSTGHDRERGLVYLRVEDQGVGIPPEHLPRLTDPFFTTKRETGGTGLGLSVSAGIVKEHGGVLEFRSTPGAGTTAFFGLPAGAGEP
jgi:polar amino acid transport system substrate-binding protein